MNHRPDPAAVRRCSLWRKSTASQAESDCVEITTELPGWIGIRDSKTASARSAVLILPFGSWPTFLTAHSGPARLK